MTTNPINRAKGERVATPAQIRVLEKIYLGTDCCNEVFDYCTLHWKQERVADTMHGLVTSKSGVVEVDDDGFMKMPERHRRGFRLTLKGYRALTAHDPAGYPPYLRRFVPRTAGKGRGKKSHA